VSKDEPGSGGTSTSVETAKQQAQKLSGTATEKAADVASTASSQVTQVANVAGDQAKALLTDLKSQVAQQGETRATEIAEAVTRTGGQLRALAEGNADGAGPLADYLRQAADSLEQWSDRLRTRGMGGVMNEVQGFAQRKPGTFLLGATVAGFVVARLVRASREAEAPGSSPPNGFRQADRSSLAEPQRRPMMEPEIGRY
jgi:hypothetical protein